MKKIKSVLIANRGEIAVRIIKSLKKRSIKSYSIFKIGEEDLPHVELADCSICLGDGSLTDTYLNMDKIIEIAISNKIDAIHPGYGFLSENAKFCEEVKNNNIIFIGPSSENIVQMGDKITSKEVAGSAGLPLVPGFNVEKISSEEILSINNIGYPILIKATAGGGGKGMKLVNSEAELQEAFESAKREALNAFNNDRVFIEKYIQSPRHVEIQVFSDSHGNHFHIFDRECSIQRRHQKIIEEAPCPFITENTRNKMIESALKLCEKINYIGAGTVEFLVDCDQNFYFLEMNTRLQVEHPVSEFISGIDLVDTQIDVAEGKKIDLSKISKKGHAVEVRVYAEDPYNNFLPQIGKLKLIVEKLPNNIRLDFGYKSGNTITTDFDPMIGKIIVYADSREECLMKLSTVLEKVVILGLKTNLSFLNDIVNNDDFKKGDTLTSFIETHQNLTKVGSDIPDPVIAAIQHIYKIDKSNSIQNTNYNLYEQFYDWRI